MAVKLLLFLLLLSEVLSPKGQPIKASSQARNYFKPAFLAALEHTLLDWAHVQKNAVGDDAGDR